MKTEKDFMRDACKEAGIPFVNVTLQAKPTPGPEWEKPKWVCSNCGNTEQTEIARLRAINSKLRADLAIVADHLEKAEKFSAVEYSDELLVPYSDIAKFVRLAIEESQP